VAEVTGKTLKYIQNSIEVAVRKVDFDRNFAMLDSTNSTTTSPGMESLPGRAKSTVKIETDLLDVLGAEVTTGTLTAGTKYIVTATASLFDGLWAVGRIFEADGTESASGTEKVKPLGAKITGKSMSMTYAGGSFAVTNFSYDIKYSELDATTSGTASPNSEIVTGRAKITSKIDVIMHRDVADKIINAAPAAIALVVTLSSGLTITGNAIFHQMSISDEVSGIVKVSYNLEWQGIPVEVGIGYLTMATSQTFDIIFATGTSTNKAITGSLTLIGKSLTCDVSNDTLISYDGVVNGAITPSVYS
jgi:hypothetical protein